MATSDIAIKFVVKATRDKSMDKRLWQQLVDLTPNGGLSTCRPNYLCRRLGIKICIVLQWGSGSEGSDPTSTLKNKQDRDHTVVIENVYIVRGLS